MDDFGSGYSSLNMLKEAPVDEIKLDMRFLSAADSYGRAEEILHMIITMGNHMKLSIRSILSGRMEVFSVDSDVVNPVESEVFDFIASCRVLLTVTFAEKISVPVKAFTEQNDFFFCQIFCIFLASACILYIK